ncbi:Cysteine-tRNA ligase [Smittium culicis]|uniref:cysteine--tRNA ligase n=1 Tax=Smittium culicis TaxID=133412 RepID=A0A1R1YNQ8_9FUNG|nr:Cysteine-tRNA ligase [Smittium culicis]
MNHFFGCFKRSPYTSLIAFNKFSFHTCNSAPFPASNPAHLNHPIHSSLSYTLNNSSKFKKAPTHLLPHNKLTFSKNTLFNLSYSCLSKPSTSPQTSSIKMSASNLNPTWLQPAPELNRDSLKIYNSLTKTKVPFVPIKGNHVTWYGCGPTVYDSSHLGHARNYITFDFLKRILVDYFGYDVYMVMNITDIDDKIILRGRQSYLLETKKSSTLALDQQLIAEAIEAWKEYSYANIDPSLQSVSDISSPQAVEQLSLQINLICSKIDPASNPKINLHKDVVLKALNAISSASQQLSNSQTSKENALELINNSSDIFATYLDARLGSSCSDPSIFKKFTQYWENDFMSDMLSLNVQKPDLLTRVTEFIPQIILFVQQIISNGYAYEADNSVYFNVAAFDGNNGHCYAKLEPKSKGNASLMEEGEGSLGLKLAGKRSSADFALWKASKPGEPSWDSPWGNGRPGWHIECSVMASEILGKQMDIHSGGIDLAFPHHDNELAQSEAHFGNKQWVNYFMHSGHLHIEGSKMSKSLKNFITIKEALNTYSARQLRICFLQQRWDSPSDYKHSSMEEALSVETTINNFFANTLAIYRRHSSESKVLTFGPAEKELASHVADTQNKVHQALCDSFDTPQAIRSLVELVNKANIYNRQATFNSDPSSLFMAARYISKITSIFGLGSFDSSLSKIGWNYNSAPSSNSNTSTSAIDNEQVVMPFINALSKFRDSVRQICKDSDIDKKSMLKLCDEMRDTILPELGVLLDDQEDGRALVKLANPDDLKAELDAKKAIEDAKRLKKLAMIEEKQKKAKAKLELSKIPHTEMFKLNAYAGMFKEFDSDGIPTIDNEGNEITKSKRKKLVKEYESQKKLHTEYLKTL